MKTYGMKTFLLFSILSLSGCTALHSEYERPELASYVYQQGSQEKNEINPDFWLAFDDADLNALISEVLLAHNDYKVAILTAEKALRQADITATNLISTFDASLRSSGQKKLNDSSSFSKSGAGSLSVSYELDLFGRLAAERKASNLSAEAAVLDAKTARLTVAGSVAQLYWQLLYYQDAVKLTQENIEESTESLKLMKSRFDSGDVSELEVSQSESDVVSCRLAIENAKTSLENTIAAINTLRNKVPNTEVKNRGTIKGITLPEVKPGLGGDVLRFRPDIAALEARLKSALASRDVAELDMYPHLTLTAGVSSGGNNNLVDFLRDPVGSLAAMLSFPFLNYYQNRLEVDVAELDRESAEVKFVYGYYSALSEVQQALNNVDHYKSRIELDSKQLSLREQNENIYKVRYDYGNSSLKDLLDARMARRNAELSVLEDLREQLINLKALALSLGGF